MASRRFDFKFHCTKDAIIIDRLESQENKQQYIRSLILSDIAADGLRDVLQMKHDITYGAFEYVEGAEDEQREDRR